MLGNALDPTNARDSARQHQPAGVEFGFTARQPKHSVRLRKLSAPQPGQSQSPSFRLISDPAGFVAWQLLHAVALAKLIVEHAAHFQSNGRGRGSPVAFVAVAVAGREPPHLKQSLRLRKLWKAHVGQFQSPGIVGMLLGCASPASATAEGRFGLVCSSSPFSTVGRGNLHMTQYAAAPVLSTSQAGHFHSAGEAAAARGAPRACSPRAGFGMVQFLHASRERKLLKPHAVQVQSPGRTLCQRAAVNAKTSLASPQLPAGTVTADNSAGDAGMPASRPEPNTLRAATNAAARDV
jgi:hypothetical protein